MGKAAGWASTLLRFVGPKMRHMGAGIARSRAPEALAYVEQHFGRKLHEQNVLMGGRIVDLAREKKMPHEALTKLVERLRAVPANP